MVKGKFGKTSKSQNIMKMIVVHSLLQQKVKENKIFKKIPVTTNGIHQLDFLKVAVLNMAGSFRRVHFP